MAAQVTLHWFRKGIRVHDCPSLCSAVEGAKAVFPVYILDPWFANPDRVCANRYNFLLESLHDLDAQLRKLGSRLIVLQGSPAELIPALVQKWNIDRVVWEIDTEPYARERDAAITVSVRAAKPSITISAVHGHTLWEPAKLLAASKGNLTTSYQPFVNLTSNLGKPPRPFPIPSEIPPPTHGAVEQGHGVPSLAQMGYDPAKVTTPFKGMGGETAGLARLAHHMGRLPWLASFSKPDTSPTALTPDTTALSPYLKFGNVGVRKMYWDLMDAYAASRAAGRAVTSPPTSLEGQLLWREFFYAQGYAVPHFDRMEGNPVCRQIAWKHDPVLIKAWEEGRTGYPWIDAAMAQLRLEGWMHHLARHAVACFLTRGDLYQSWEHGARIFDKYLLDSDWSINVGNWLWLSASAYFYQYFRVYSPIVFPKKTDPNGDYIRKYLPAFKDFPAQYIYEPWKAPKAVQEKYGIIVGVTYPARIVEHEIASKANIAAHAAAYAAAKEGPAAAAVFTAQAGAGGKGIGQTQVGSSPTAAHAYSAAHGVPLGHIAGEGAIAEGSASSSSNSASHTAAGAGASSHGTAEPTGKRKGQQSALDEFYPPKQKKAKAGGQAGASTGARASAPRDHNAFLQDLAGAEDKE